MGLFDRMKSAMGGSGEAEKEAADGNKDTLKSGKWSTHQAITPDAFPPSLLLTSKDRGLAKKIPKELILATTKVGKHTVELLLGSSDPKSVDLSLRIPTAANQFKDPYILMEAEGGNSREDAVREINFHLQGRVEESEIAKAPWASMFAAAATKLDALRKG